MTVVFAKNKFSGFRRAKHKRLFRESKLFSYEHVSILTLGGLLRLFFLCFCLVSLIVNEYISKFSSSFLQKEFSFKVDRDDCGVFVTSQ